ncbi:MAG: sigma 54-interacting transcriptional regulator [Candidatus Cloacimonetes bacterium]|nr:sigma 54-interacting transcriptional regulator [Candidatus Cloacimonadota bacterium]
MNTVIGNVLSEYITRDSHLILEILKKLSEGETSIIEITGASGYGKSFVFEKLVQHIEKEKLRFEVLVPRVLSSNHIYDFIHLLTGINSEQYDEIVNGVTEFGLENRYDFYYYLVKHLSEYDFQPELLIIYETSFLDTYTRDFLQFIINYLPSMKTRFVIFSCESYYPDAHQIELTPPTPEDIASIIANLTSAEPNQYVKEAEIISSISDQDYYTVQYLLENYFTQSKKLNFNELIDKNIGMEKVFEENLLKLSEADREFLIGIYLLDTRATQEQLSGLAGHKITKELKTLEQHHLLMHVGDNYLVRKVSPVQKYYEQLSDKKKQELLERVHEFQSNEVCNEYLNVTVEEENRCFTYLRSICDYESLLAAYDKKLKTLPENVERVELELQKAMILRLMRRIDDAIEVLRATLKNAQKQGMEIHQIIYELADCQSINNNYTFALEVIKKYSPEDIDDYWHWKIVLLKSRLFMQQEDFSNAFVVNDEAHSLTSKINDTRLNMQMRAETRKLRGLIHYYNNDYIKAHAMFEDALKLFRSAEDISGKSAANNNLGVLAMTQGDWKETEQLYLESLKLDEQRFNLNGISYVYNNLGYLFDEMGDYERSLHYLRKAYDIQLLLNDRYTMANILINIGVNHMDNGKYQEAASSFQEALQISIKFNYYRLEIASMDNLGVCYFRWGDWNKAISYYNRAIKKSQENNFFEGLCQSYNNIGELYMRRGELELAMDFYQQAKELLPKFNDEFQKADLFGNMGLNLTLMSKYSESYSYLVNSYEFFKTIGQKDKIIEGALGQALYFIRTSNLESARYYIEYSLKLAEELNDEYRLGQVYYRRAILNINDSEAALNDLVRAVENFRKTNKNFELTLANYEYARLISQKGEWEQALQILEENKAIIKKFGAVKFLEENDILINHIRREFKSQMKESKQQESLLNQFYEVTQALNSIQNFDSLMQLSIDKVSEFAEADGGIIAFYHNDQVNSKWEYLFYNNFSAHDKDFDILMEVIKGTYDLNEAMNHKQPHFAPSYNNIISFPLTVRNEKKGVVLLFSRYETRYFNEKIVNLISALCNQLVVIVENILFAKLQRSHASIREELAQSSDFPEIIGNSEKIQHIFRLIDKIKDTPTTILLEGDSGTGKELIARAIHFNSIRRNKHFVAQYCGALPETLLESELFGHVKGSFTGATHDKKGLFEIANGGTFFLDEIADISLSTQAKLLRFLQEGEIKRVGSTVTEKVDVRVVCATNVSLKEKVARSEFRQDLYYRLNVIRIQVPSLRERRSDIPLLSVHFLDKYCKKIGKKVGGISEEALRYLMNYSWPGNIRQLENEIERAVTLADDDDLIKSSDLSPEVFHFQEDIETLNLLENNSLKAQVERLEKKIIEQTLEESNGNQTQAARVLNMSRQGLIKKIQRYGIAKSEDEED